MRFYIEKQENYLLFFSICFTQFDNQTLTVLEFLYSNLYLFDLKIEK